MCVRQSGKIVLSAVVPVSGLDAFRAAHPGATACAPSRRPGAGPTNAAALLDASNSGTFSDARRSALLGHRDPDKSIAAIGALSRAAENGRLDVAFAGRRIAELASPGVAAGQPIQTRAPETAAEARARRNAEALTRDRTALSAAQTAKLAEACLPRTCFMSGNVATGRATSINYSTITREEAAALSGFLRFCTPEDIRNASAPPEAWGEWLVVKLRRVPEALGLAARRPTRVTTFALPAPGATPAPGAAPAPGAPPPVSETLRSPDGALVAVVPAWQVPARLAQGWTRV